MKNQRLLKKKIAFVGSESGGKRAFYTDSLPQSDYIALDIEYEYHTEV